MIIVEVLSGIKIPCSLFCTEPTSPYNTFMLLTKGLLHTTDVYLKKLKDS